MPSHSENPLHVFHPRTFEANRYVYPVLSRRAGGISLGVNLNRDKFCNFDCVYCQVDRQVRSQAEVLDLNILAAELDGMVEFIVSGRFFEETSFRHTPQALRRLNDIALSGDGEPTAHPNFLDAVTICAEVRKKHDLSAVKIVLITNATQFHRKNVEEALEILDRNHGEIWAKLDAGTEAYYQQVDRSAVAFAQVLSNLKDAAQRRPIVIQSLFMRLHEIPPTDEEIAAYCDRLNEIVAAGGKIKLVQVHTVARMPAESWVTALKDEKVDAIAARVREKTGLPTAAFYGG